MSVVLKPYLNGVVIGENQVFYGLVYLDGDGIRVSEEIVSFANIERTTLRQTTDDSLTDVATVTIPEFSTVLIIARVVARRVSGSAGTNEDGLAYELRASFKNVAGNAVQMGSTVIVFNEKDQLSWDVSFGTASNDVLVQVTGAVDNVIDWRCAVTKHIITTIYNT